MSESQFEQITFANGHFINSLIDEVVIGNDNEEMEVVVEFESESAEWK
jgi:hypothetical protein